MQANDIHGLLQKHFGDKPGFDANGSKEVANALANVSKVVDQHAGAAPVTHPTHKQQQCYAQCQKTRDAALAAAGLKGWPFGAAAAAAAVLAFNACRHNCDQNP